MIEMTIHSDKALPVAGTFIKDMSRYSLKSNLILSIENNEILVIRYAEMVYRIGFQIHTTHLSDLLIYISGDPEFPSDAWYSAYYDKEKLHLDSLTDTDLTRRLLISGNWAMAEGFQTSTIRSEG